MHAGRGLRGSQESSERISPQVGCVGLPRQKSPRNGQGKWHPQGNQPYPNAIAVE